MATAGDRLQIVLTAKDEISAELRRTKAEMTSLGRTAASLQSRMEAGEQGLQNEYEQTRRELEQNRLKQLELGRSASKARTEIRQMTTDGTAGAKRMDRSMDSLNRSMDKTHRTSKTMAVGWGKVMGAAGAVTAAIGATAGAFRFLGDSVNEARDARKAMAQTAAVMRSMGRTEAPKAITKMINRLEELSGIDGDALREMTNVMFTFGNVTDETFTRANELALDLSVSMGKDLQSSAVMVGKALNDPIKGLTSLQRVGVSFTAQQTEQIKGFVATNDLASAQKIIMKELGREFDGSAKAQANGIAKTQVAWGNLKEAIGEVIMSISTGMGGDAAGGIKSFTKIVQENRYIIVSVFQVILSAVFKLISIWLKWESIVLKVVGSIIGGIANVIDVMAILDPSLKGAAEKTHGLADGFYAASEAANDASTWFNNASTNAKNASERTRDLHEALKQIDGKKAKASVEVTLKAAWDAVDSATAAASNPPKKPKGQRFAGGPVSSGAWLVGELGPELMIPKSGSPFMVGTSGPEVRDFSTPGYVIPNHLLTSTVTSTTVRERTTERVVERGPLVENLVVRSEADAMRELQRMRARESRIARERGA